VQVQVLSSMIALLSVNYKT